MGKYKVTPTSFPPLSGEKGHHGTGDISNGHNLVFPHSVDQDINSKLQFQYRLYEITVMSFEISGNDMPNWFGVSFRKGIRSFSAVNIFCHPVPGTAGMVDGDYLSRAGKWPELFRYAEMLGRQLAVASNDQIVIVPFFSNASYGTTGIFGPNWKDIVTDILTAVRSKMLQACFPEDVVLKDVVLSDFSHGRNLMRSIREKAPGLNSYLREIWDFDGVGPSGPPYTSGGIRGIIYDQKVTRDRLSYHVPPQRWLDFHHKLVDCHSNIPDMLGWHAATVSAVGR